MRRLGDTSFLSADNAAVTTVAFADVAGLGQAILSGRAYKFTSGLVLRSAAVTTGLRVSVNGPAFTVLGYLAEYPGATDGVVQEQEARAYDIGTVTTAVAVANGDYFARIDGIIVPSANGTLIPRVASEVAGSGITVRRGSYFEVVELG